MKRLLLLLSLMLLSVQVSLAAGYCPTNDEIQIKMRHFQMRAHKNLDTRAPIEQVEALNNEMMQYQANLVPNCIQYFKSTPNPECKRLATLATGYMFLDRAKQPAAKTSILDIAKRFDSSCPAKFMIIDLLVK